MDINDILATIPHRYPMLLVDRVISIQDDSIEAVKNVSANEPFFLGHFPSNPVMPGVLIIEALAQAGSILAAQTKPSPTAAIQVFAGIEQAKFKKIVVPGDQLILKVTCIKKKQHISKLQGAAFVDHQLVCSVNFTSASKIF